MAQCLKPFTVTHDHQCFDVPCGKCPNCLARRASGWSFRLLEEERHSSSSYFLTLTYDTTTVPITSNGFMSLNKRDVQLFMKRLRKAHPTNVKIKYYVVGEYGGKTNRPHYHMLLFNADQMLIQDAWQNGDIHYGQVTGASVGYTLKYMMKQPRIPMHRNDDRLREFSLMSKGLGISYMTPAMILWHKDDLENRMYCNIEGGKKISMPRYYKNKIYTDEEREDAGIATLNRMRSNIERLQSLGQECTAEQYQAAVNSAYVQMHQNAVTGRNKI